MEPQAETQSVFSVLFEIEIGRARRDLAAP